MLGGDTFILIYMILVSCVYCLLIYIYELFINIYLYFVLCETYKNVLFFIISNLGGELVYIFVGLLFFCHTCVHAFVECFRNIQVDSIELLSTLATNG